VKAGMWVEKGGGMMRLRVGVGGFDGTLPLEPWLLRTQLAVSDVHLDQAFFPLGPTTTLGAKGAGLGAFSPDWMLAVLGPEIVELAGEPERVTAGLAIVALRPPTAPLFVLPTTF